MTKRLAVVVIGRNEAQHLEASLRSVTGVAEQVVYVDSASSDGSTDLARGAGVAVVCLEQVEPMSAARGRNAGREYVRANWPEVDLIQFVDGDTELTATWLTRASAFLDAHPDVGVVAGRLREKSPHRNAFHRLADMEFDGDAGEVDAVGGIAMYRTAAFDEAGGFDPWVVSGEERELHLRMARNGNRVIRLPDTMAYHDIDMDHIEQWWVRTMRSGQTYAEHWMDRRIMGRRVLSIALWGGLLPGLALGMALPSFGLSLGLLAPHALLYRRVRRDRILRGYSDEDASLYALGTVAGKVPEMAGASRLLLNRLRG